MQLPNSFGRFSFVKMLDPDDFAYEYFYQNRDHYKPSFNLTTNEEERCAVRITVGKQSSGSFRRPVRIWMSNHFPHGTDYGKNELRIGSIRHPLELVAGDEVEFDDKSGIFFVRGKKISLNRILEKLFQFHMRPLQPLRGIPLRLRDKISYSIFGNFEKWVGRIFSLKGLLDGTEAAKREKFNILSAEPYRAQHFTKTKDHFINFPGLPEATKLTALILAAASSLFVILNWKIFKLPNEVAIALYAGGLICLYITLEWVIPAILRSAVNWIIRSRDRLLVHRFKL